MLAFEKSSEYNIFVRAGTLDAYLNRIVGDCAHMISMLRKRCSLAIRSAPEGVLAVSSEVSV
jgi:hypothetical protein